LISGGGGLAVFIVAAGSAFPDFDIGNLWNHCMDSVLGIEAQRMNDPHAGG